MTTYDINTLQLMGRRIMPSGYQRPYFLTLKDKVVYHDVSDGIDGWHTMPFSLAAVLEMIDGWERSKKWVPSFTFHTRYAAVRARAGLPEIKPVDGPASTQTLI